MTTADGRSKEVEAAAEHPIVAAMTSGQVFRWAVAAALGVLSVSIISAALYNVRNILVLVVIALFIAISLDPAVRWLIRHGIRRSISVSIILLFVLGLMAVFVWSIVPPLIDEGSSLLKKLPEYVRELPARSESLRKFGEQYNLTTKITDYAAGLPAQIVGSGVGFLRRFLGAVLSGLTVLVLTIYFMADLPRLRRGIVRLFPRTQRTWVGEAVDVVVDKVGAYMIGNIIISMVAGVSTFVCLQVLRVDYALPLALAVAIADMIPLIGASLGAAVCMLVTVFTADLWPTAVIVLIFFVVYQQVENYLIAPRVLRNTVDLPALAILLTALIGGSVLGLVGALMAIPIAAAVKVLLSPTIAAMHAHPEPVPAHTTPVNLERATPDAQPVKADAQRATPDAQPVKADPEPLG
jgi:predicted PurR-regulated permease PerM